MIVSQNLCGGFCGTLRHRLSVVEAGVSGFNYRWASVVLKECPEDVSTDQHGRFSRDGV